MNLKFIVKHLKMSSEHGIFIKFIGRFEIRLFPLLISNCFFVFDGATATLEPNAHLSIFIFHTLKIIIIIIKIFVVILSSCFADLATS